MMKKAFSVFAIAVLSFVTLNVSWAAPNFPVVTGHAAMDKNGDYLISSKQGQAVNIYRTASQELLQTLRFAKFVDNFSGVSALAVDGTNLVAACAVTKKSGPGVIYLFDLQSAKLRGFIGGLPTAVTAMAFSGNGRYLAASTDRQGLLFYKMIHLQKINISSITSLSDGEKSALDKLGHLQRDVIDQTLALHDRSLKGNVTALGFDGRANLVAATDDGNLHLYNSDFKLTKSVKTKSGTQPAGLAFNPDYTKIAVTYADKPTIDVYAATVLAFLYSPDTTSVSAAFSGNPVWSTDGRFLYAIAPATNTASTDIYTWKNAGEGNLSHLSNVSGKSSRIAPVMGGGLVYTDASDNLSMLNKRYGVIYNEWGNVWVSAGHKYGDVTYQIGGDYRTSSGTAITTWFPKSELIWPINAFMGEIGGLVRLGKRIEIKGAFSHNISNNLSGKMEDSDWVEDPDFKDVYSESKTDYRGYVGDASMRFWILDRHYANDSSLSIGAGAGFTYQNYYWEASNGYQWAYTAYTQQEYGSGPLPGKCITYRAELYMPYLEVLLKSRHKKIDFTGAFGFSPYLLAKDEDDHVRRKFLTKTDAHGYAIKGSLQANYNFTERWFAGLRTNLLYFSAEGKGKSVFYENTIYYPAGFRFEWDHKITSFQLDTMLLAGFRF